MLLVATALAMVHIRDLLAVAMLSGIYSFLAACLFLSLDAVDVAFTEVVVGSGIATVLLLLTLSAGKTSSQPSHKPWLALLAVTLTGAIIVYGTYDLPAFGDPNAPIQQHVSPRYLQQSAQEIGIPNVVTSILASYRGYDTLGEVCVIFTAGIGVISLLGLGKKKNTWEAPLRQIILRTLTPLLIPLILLFALYVQFHGDFGPGGGFQAGVLFAAGFILYGLVFGLRAARALISPRALHALMASGLLLYLLVGLSGLLLGGSFLDYNVLGDNPKAGQHLGIFLVETGVGVAVFAVMWGIFLAFAHRDTP